MTTKKLLKLPIEDGQNCVKSFIPLGILEGSQPGPTLAVITGMHATEYVSQDGVARFWKSLDPNEISGKLLVVLGADVRAMFAHSMWTNPVDGKRMGSGFPGNKDGTLTEVITYTLWNEVVTQADAVLDCHGGEYSENMTGYIITYATGNKTVDQKALDLAMALGVPFVEVREVENSTGMVPLAMQDGRPAMVIELGGRGERGERSVAAVFTYLQNALRHLGMKPGSPVRWAGEPIRLNEGIILNTTRAGLWEPAVVNGQWIETGAVFGCVRDFDGTLLEEVVAPEAGVVLTVINARCIDGGEETAHFLKGFAGKIGVLGNPSVQ